MGGTKTRARILRISREVTAEWKSDPGLQQVLREIRPGFAKVVDELTEAVFESGNRARLREAGFETARVTGAHTSEIDSGDFVR